MKTSSYIPSGSVVGIIGGGQLGRMTALAAANLGYKTHIYCPEEDSPASHVAYRTTVASYLDEAALEAFARSVDVITFEFENIPSRSVQILSQFSIVRPTWEVLHIAQNRLREKDFVTACGIGTARYCSVSSEAELQAAVQEIGLPCILKTTEQGYDGKGQFVLRVAKDVTETIALLFSGKEVIAGAFVLEAFVDYSHEISVVLARNAAGEVACFPVTENRHVDGILDISSVPASINADIAEQAQHFTRIIAEKLELVGMLAVEFFVTKDNKVLVNEMAPRPHNSGHWTMDACVTSQFEQFVRAVCNLPLGAVTLHSKAEMKNLIGDEVSEWKKFSSEPHAKLHIYGKSVIKKGRKMGHVTRIFSLNSSEIL